MKKIDNTIDENLGNVVTVFCKNSTPITGALIDWTSALDNDPDPESITIETAELVLYEIFVRDIIRIEEVKD